MLQMYAVLDKAVGAFMQPFFVRARGEAIRTFSDAVNDPQSPFNKHVQDFELFGIGVFDPSNGQISDVSSVRILAAADVLKVSGKI